MLQAAADAALGVLPINKKGFMSELTSLLVFMEEEDRARVIRRYERMFDAAGPEGEEDLAVSLGSPIRQVLAVEKEYSRARAEGKTPFLDADEPENGPEKDISTLVKEAADALGGPAGDQTLFPATEKAAEEAFEQIQLDDNAFSEPAEEEPSGESVIPDMEGSEPETSETDGEAEPADDGEKPAGEEPEEEELLRGEPLTTIYDETEEKPESLTAAEPEKEKTAEASAEGEAEPSGEPAPAKSGSPGAGRILAAIVVTLPFLLWWAAGFAVSLALGAVILAAGFGICVAGVYLGGYALSGAITFMPDKLLVGGGALACFAAALLLIWTGLWIMVGGIAFVIRTSAKAYRRILNRPETDEEDENDG